MPEKRDETHSCFISRLHHEAGNGSIGPELKIPQEGKLTADLAFHADFNDRACKRSRQMMKRPDATMMAMPIHLETFGKSPKMA
jgi:hypothetical protein